MFLLLALGFLLAGIAGARGVLPQALGLLSLGAFFICVLCAMLFGYMDRRAMTESRSRNSAHTMLVMMAGMLQKEDDATLKRIAAAGGPAGQAAGMLLEQRKTVTRNQ